MFIYFYSYNDETDINHISGTSFVWALTTFSYHVFGVIVSSQKVRVY